MQLLELDGNQRRQLTNIEPRSLSALTDDRDTQHAMAVFFAAEIHNPNTRRAYKRGAGDFFSFAFERAGVQRIDEINALHIASWIEHEERSGQSAPTIKQRLAGLRMLFQSLVRQRILSANPAHVVKGPKHSVRKGKTPVLNGKETLQLLQAIDISTLIGQRDRAMIGTMAYSFARIGAVTALKVGDVFHQKRRLWLRLAEKGGKTHDIPCHHHLETCLGEWLEAAGHRDQPQAPLFQTFSRTGKRSDGVRALSGKPMTQAVTWDMVQRRAKAAGIDTAICNHTFRATGITAYLSNGGTIESAAIIAGHVSTRTTQLYDRRPDDVTLDEIEKIRFT